MATPQQSNMTFFEHLEEMRGHLFRSAIVVLVVSVVLIFFKEFIFDTLLFGPLNTNFISYQLLCMLAPEFCIKEIPFELMNTELAGQFFIHLKAAFILGFIFSVPYIFWEIWKFISPALLPSEMSYARKLLGAGSILFFIGVIFAYYMVIPLSILFFSTYTISDRIVNRFSIDNYFSFLSDTILWSGLSFELPIIVYFLAKLDILTVSFLQNYRRHLYVFIFVLAAAITPSPDILSQVMVAIPLLLLFEVSIVVAQRVQKGKELNND